MIVTEKITSKEWTATDTDWYDGAPDAGIYKTYGWGLTEQGAIDDLIEKAMEAGIYVEQL